MVGHGLHRGVRRRGQRLRPRRQRRRRPDGQRGRRLDRGRRRLRRPVAARTPSCSSTAPSSATTCSTARATTPTTTASPATTSWSRAPASSATTACSASTGRSTRATPRRPTPTWASVRSKPGEEFILRDRFDSVEGLSGWNERRCAHRCSKASDWRGLHRRAHASGRRSHPWYAFAPESADPAPAIQTTSYSNPTPTRPAKCILGGDGSDTIRGNLGDDILDGDAWLNVRISVHASKDASGPTGPEIATFDSLTSQLTWTGSGLPASWQATNNQGIGIGVTKSLSELMRTGIVNPGQLEAVREILYDNTQVGNSTPGHDRDIAVFSDVFENYTIERDAPGNIGDGADADTFITVAHTPPVVGGGGGAARTPTASTRFATLKFSVLRIATSSSIRASTIRPRPAC